MKETPSCGIVLTTIDVWRLFVILINLKIFALQVNAIVEKCRDALYIFSALNILNPLVFASKLILDGTKSSKSAKSKKDFPQLLNDVVFVLSGYQNPKRGEIRDKALMMGAKYRRDWGSDCTHLV